MLGQERRQRNDTPLWYTQCQFSSRACIIIGIPPSDIALIVSCFSLALQIIMDVSLSVKYIRVRIIVHLDLETPAPRTPGIFSSPTLKSRPIESERTPIINSVKPANSQKGTLTSIFAHVGPAQCVTLPDSALVLKHLQT